MHREMKEHVVMTVEMVDRMLNLNLPFIPKVGVKVMAFYEDDELMGAIEYNTRGYGFNGSILVEDLKLGNNDMYHSEAREVVATFLGVDPWK